MVREVDPIPETEIKNGNPPFERHDRQTGHTDSGGPDCPNPSWTESRRPVAPKIEVFQAGVLVLMVDSTFSSPAANGPVPGRNVSCTQS